MSSTMTETGTSQGFVAARQGTATPLEDQNFVAKITRDYDDLSKSFLSGKTKTHEWRVAQLEGIVKMFMENQGDIVAALKADLGRPEYETMMCDIGGTLSEVRFMIDNLKAWMRPESVSTDLLNQPASSRIEKVPKGVVFILGAWNFPINLVLAPAAAAIAAGNCVVMKPSEVSAASERLMVELIPKYLDSEAIRVVTGGVPETTELLKLPWHHIFYTGNTAVAKIIMAAAAKHLTPVTLECGGKSPVYVDKGLSASQLRTACKRILHAGLWLNAGQICVSPDYVLVHKDAEDALKEMLKKVNAEFAKENAEFGTIVNSRHFDRLSQLLENTGGEIVIGGTAAASREKCLLPPTIISRPNVNAPIMQQEIFGPIFSVLPVENAAAACAFIRARDHPLSLYIFTNENKVAEEIIANTNSGGVLINDTLTHLGNPNLPFGGVGNSGFGQYHGKFGFDEFSHKRAIMHKGLFIDLDRYPPYDATKLKLIRMAQSGFKVPGSVKATLVALMAAAGYYAVQSQL